MRPTLSGWTRFVVFSRSLFIQAGFNPQTMQSLGLLYALLPALEELYPDEARRAEAVKRHLSTFNTHPYVAAAIIGGILFHEERVARGEEPAERVDEFKRSLMGPLAALGDGFFWLSLRPAAGAIAVALVPWLHAWSAVVFLVLYNSVHVYARARLFSLGLNHGEGLLQWLKAVHVPLWGERLRSVAAALAGGLAAWLALQFGSQQGGGAAGALAGGCLVMGAFAFRLVKRGLSPYVLLYGAALISGALGVFL